MSSSGSPRTSRLAVRSLLVHLVVLQKVSGFSLNALTTFRTKAHHGKDVPGLKNCHKQSESAVGAHVAQAPDMIRRASAINMNYMSSGRYPTRSRMYDDDDYGSRRRWSGDSYMYRPVTGGGDIRSGGNVRDMSWMGNGQPMFYEQANRYGYSARRGRYEGMGNYGRGRYDYDDRYYDNRYNRYGDGYGYDSRHDRGWGTGRYNNAYSSRRRYDDDRYDNYVYDRRYDQGRYNDRYYGRYNRYDGYGYGSRYMPETGGGDIRQGGNVKHISWSGNDDMKYLPGRTGSRRDVQIEHHLRNGALSDARALGWRD